MNLRLALILSLLFIFIGFAGAYLKFADVDYLLVIHFDSYRGIDFLGDRTYVFGTLLAGLAINVINFALVGVFYNRERFLSYLIAYSTAFLSLLILIITAVIISVN